MKLTHVAQDDRLAILVTLHARRLASLLDELARHDEPELVALWDKADQLEKDIIHTLNRLTTNQKGTP